MEDLVRRPEVVERAGREALGTSRGAGVSSTSPRRGSDSLQHRAKDIRGAPSDDQVERQGLTSERDSLGDNDVPQRKDRGQAKGYEYQCAMPSMGSMMRREHDLELVLQRQSHVRSRPRVLQI